MSDLREKISLAEFDNRLNRIVSSYGLADRGFELSRDIILGRRDRIAGISFRLEVFQSCYKHLAFELRIRLYEELKRTIQTFDDGSFEVQVNEKTNLPTGEQCTFSFNVLPDEVDMPAEMPPQASLPDFPECAAAPLVMLLTGIFTYPRSPYVSYDYKFPLAQRFMSKLADELFWQINVKSRKAPEYSNTASIRSNLHDCEEHVREEDLVSVKCWQITLGLAAIYDEYQRSQRARIAWLRDIYGVESYPGDMHTKVGLGEGPVAQSEAETFALMAKECTRGLQSFVGLGLGEGMVSWELETIACLKRLRAMALGFQVIKTAFESNPAKIFKEAEIAGKALIAVADWPL